MYKVVCVHRLSAKWLKFVAIKRRYSKPKVLLQEDTYGVIDLDWEVELKIAGRYSGRVPGHVFVLTPNSISDTCKGPVQLLAFRDYAPEAWERKTFTNMSVFFQ